MADRDKIIAILSKRLQEVRRKELTFGDVVGAMGAASPAVKTTLLSHVVNSHEVEFATLVFELIQDKLNKEAKDEAEGALATDSISLANLERIF